MCGFTRAHNRLFHQLPCPIDVTERPISLSKVNRCNGARIGAEAELGVTVALGIVDPERLIEARACFDTIACQRHVRPKMRWTTAASVVRDGTSHGDCLRELIAEVLPYNVAMVVFEKSGLSLSTSRESQTVRVVLRLT
jgi:hypothetical protein